MITAFEIREIRIIFRFIGYGSLVYRLLRFWLPAQVSEMRLFCNYLSLKIPTWLILLTWPTNLQIRQNEFSLVISFACDLNTGQSCMRRISDSCSKQILP